MSVLMWFLCGWAIGCVIIIGVICYCTPGRNEVQERIDFLKDEIRRVERRWRDANDRLWALAEAAGFEFDIQPEKLVAVKKKRK